MTSSCGYQSRTLVDGNPLGSGAQIIRGNETVGLADVGKQMTFQNSLGDFTTITVEATPPNWQIPDCIVWHYRKSTNRAYWQPGAVNADLQFVLCQQSNGEWLAKASTFSGDGGPGGNTDTPWIATQNIDVVPGWTPGYIIVPAEATRDVTNSQRTEYRNWNLPGVRTFDSIINNPNAHTADRTWRTDSYIEHTCVPYLNWCGDALVSEQWEACPTDTWNAVGSCVHEKWLLAPGMGLVEVRIVNMGNGDGQGFCTLHSGVKECYGLDQISFKRVG